MANVAHNTRKNRESLSKRLGKVAKQIKARDNHACVYCAKTELTSGAHLHLDHVVPRNSGGKDLATNIVVACRSCNSAKQDLSLAGFAAYARAKMGLTFSPAAIRAQAKKVLS